MKITLDEGYQFGLGLFETIAVENGTALLLDWHLERLHHSMEVLGIQQTVSQAQVEAYLSCQAAEHHALKIMVSAENSIFTLRPNPYTRAQCGTGFSLAYSPVLRNETSILTRHKTMNYGDCILEKRRAKTVGVDELLFCNSRGEICEGTTTNIFFGKDGRLYTPPVSCGLLPGVMRRYILSNYPVTEQILKREDIPHMEECFVTNSLMGIMPVKTLDSVSFQNHAMTQTCIEQWRREIDRTNF